MLLICLGLTSIAQKNIKIYGIKENGKTVLYAQNNEFCPVSILLTLDLRNMKATEGTGNLYVVPVNAKRFRLTVLSRLGAAKFGFSYTYTAYYGNVNQVGYQKDHVYDLPFKDGLKFKIGQGYNGQFSHKNENALDFDMPVGTEILAAREGIVVDVVQQFLGACLSQVCKKKANYVLIYHADGTFAYYAHIQYNGAKVKVGDRVNSGDVIALSGNTGFTKGPHLHFVCFLPRISQSDGKESLATKFWTGNGNSAEFLKENKTYKRKYED